MASNSSATASSMDIEREEERKSCQRCRGRMSSIKFDKHLICIKCRGQSCLNKETRCIECVEWSEDDFLSYVKHRAKLDSKAKSKKSIKEARSSVDKSILSEVEMSDSSLVSESNTASAVGVTEVPLSRSAVAELVANSVSSSVEEFSNNFSEQFSCAMSDAFSQI